MTGLFVISALVYISLPGPLSAKLTVAEVFLNIVIVLIPGVLGRLIQQRHPGHMVASLLLLVTLALATMRTALIVGLVNEKFVTNAAPAIETVTLMIEKSFYLAAVFIPLLLIPLYFPTGKLLTPRWRPLAIWFTIVLVGAMLLEVLRPWPEPVPAYIDARPFAGIQGPALLFDVAGAVIGLSFAAIIMLMVLNILLRYKRSTAHERTQMKWPFFTTIGTLFIAAIVWNSPFLAAIDEQSGFLITWSLIMLYPISIAIAILQHQLWDIDIVINRALVFGGLTALIIVGYFALVGLLGALFHNQFNALSGIIATAVIAILFQPVRERLQKEVNRLLYGDRDRPDRVLSRVTEHLKDPNATEAILPTLAETVRATLNVPYVAIYMPGEIRTPQASAGQPGAETEQLRLEIRPGEYGQMTIGKRGPHEEFTRAEQQLLESIATLAANIVRTVKLSDELRKSREQIVTAREEERRRLRRDLHDGLGPQLASQTLTLEAVTQLISPENKKAISLLETVKQQAEAATADIRRIVYDLRPPALDTLGLAGALYQVSQRLQGGPQQIDLDFPENMPALSAALETAIYRIVQEGLTNVIRHAAATAARVSLQIDNGQLRLEIADDGIGLEGSPRPGVRLQAMHERVTELNGTLSIEQPPSGGTLIRATFPIQAANE